jgi:hypothetical protein
MLWHSSAALAVRAAREGFVKMAASRKDGKYRIRRMEAAIPEPLWPGWTKDELVKRAFPNRIIDSATHPVLLHEQGKE